MENKYLLAIDQGTTGSTVLVVSLAQDDRFMVLGRETVDFRQHYPHRGWVEHDLDDIWQSVKKATLGAIAKAKTSSSEFHEKSITAIGITNQRETLCVFDKKTGRPLRKAIVWQCKRSHDICEKLKKDGLTEVFQEKTGLLIDPYFSGTKLTWLMEHDKETASAIQSGEAVVGTIDSYLVCRLSGGKTHVTEPSNASRTLLYNIKEACWDEELLKILKVPDQSCLAEVKDSAGSFSHTAGLDFLPDGIVISGVLGDQQAALAGQTCFSKGEAKCTYGTGAFLLANIGQNALISASSILTTVAWSVGGELTYAFEGSSFIAGAAVQFARDNLGFIEHAKETQELAEQAEAAPHIYFVPALAGLGAPWWNPKAHGAFLGLTRSTSREQMLRAVLEGIAFQVCDLKQAMEEDLKTPLSILRVDGGASANDLLMQAQSDFAQVDVDRPEVLETTAFGAALFAGLGAGLFSDLSSLSHVRKTEHVFKPRSNVNNNRHLKSQLEGWQKAVEAVQVFSQHQPK